MTTVNHLCMTNWCLLPTPIGEFRMYDVGDGSVRILSVGSAHDLGSQPLVRIQSSCMASEVFGALDCDCADQLRQSMKLMTAEGRGLIVHLHQEGRGHGLSTKIRAVSLMQRERLDTVEAFDALHLEQDIRRYDQAVFALASLGVYSVRLITNSPGKQQFLQDAGIQAEMVHVPPVPRDANRKYLETKIAKLGHKIQLHDHENSSDPIYFYHSDHLWGAFSNFSRHAVLLRDRIWPTVEHYYQAQKFADTMHEEAIRRCATPMEAKQYAEKLRHMLDGGDRTDAMERVMLAGLRAKFQQHPDLKELLVHTGNRQIIEDTKTDAFWGSGHDGRGLNRLGALLMRVRAELQQCSGSTSKEERCP